MFIALDNDNFLNLDHVARISVIEPYGEEDSEKIELHFISAHQETMGTYTTTREKLRNEKIFKEIFEHNRPAKN